MLGDDLEKLPRAHGAPLGTARLKAEPEDFIVDEDLGFPLSGDGEHVFVRVEKRGWTTDQVARELGRHCKVRPVAVSHAGMKDRHGVTRQWFSVQMPGQEAPLELGEFRDGVRILELGRNRRKLRRGALLGNRFSLRLRELDAAPPAVHQRLARIARLGVPNYFGTQRFGRDGDNVAQARAMFAGEFRPRSRSLRGLLLSAARSALFNAVLAERVEDGSWNRLQPGELVVLDGRQSLFAAPDIDVELRRRAMLRAVHPTGPLPGRGGMRPEGAVAALEERVLAQGSDLLAGLEAAGVEAARRALRLRVSDLSWHFERADVLCLSFGLSAGSYATVVVREVFDTVER